MALALPATGLVRRSPRESEEEAQVLPMRAFLLQLGPCAHAAASGQKRLQGGLRIPVALHQSRTGRPRTRCGRGCRRRPANTRSPPSASTAPWLRAAPLRRARAARVGRARDSDARCAACNFMCCVDAQRRKTSHVTNDFPLTVRRHAWQQTSTAAEMTFSAMAVPLPRPLARPTFPVSVVLTALLRTSRPP